MRMVIGIEKTSKSYW